MPNPPKPPKGEKYGAASNDWMAGEMEAEAEKERKKANPPPKAPPPKRYARGGGIEIKGKTKGRFV